MIKKSAMLILLAGLAVGFWAISFSWAQTIVSTAPDNEAIGFGPIHDEGYGNADAEYYGSKDDLVNDEEFNEQGPQK
ncbi:MAG: hypothetical protein HQL14_04620 [Candidatus Omnitrophica bacterium]|nr:hypothetical protein [Candidatus Omnitrophota bacterium]